MLDFLFNIFMAIILSAFWLTIIYIIIKGIWILLQCLLFRKDLRILISNDKLIKFIRNAKLIQTNSAVQVISKSVLSSRRNKVISVAIVAIVLIGGFKYLNNPERKAWKYTQEIIKSEIDHPSSADFGSMSDARIIYQGNNTWRVDGVLKAKDVVGKMVEAPYSVTFDITDNGYKLVSTSLR